LYKIYYTNISVVTNYAYRFAESLLLTPLRKTKIYNVNIDRFMLSRFIPDSKIHRNKKTLSNTTKLSEITIIVTKQSSYRTVLHSERTRPRSDINSVLVLIQWVRQMFHCFAANAIDLALTKTFNSYSRHRIDICLGTHVLRNSHLPPCSVNRLISAISARQRFTLNPLTPDGLSCYL